MNIEQNKIDQISEISLKDIFLKIKQEFICITRLWKILIFSALVGAFAGFLYAYPKKTIYTAKLSFALEDDSKMTGSGALSLASSFGLDLGGDAGGAFSSNNLMELMKSRTIIEKTLLTPVFYEGERISLAEMYLQINGIRQKWMKSKESLSKSLIFPPRSNSSAFSKSQDSVISIIYNNLVSKNITIGQKDKKTSITVLVVQSENEIFAKLFAESLVKEVSDFYISTKVKRAKLNISVLETQVDSVRSALSGAMTGVALANDVTYNLNPAYNIKKIPSTRSQFDVQTNVAILTELIKNLEAAKVALRKETPLFQVIDLPVLPLEKQRVSVIKSAIIGAFMAVFLSVFFTLSRRWVMNILK